MGRSPQSKHIGLSLFQKINNSNSFLIYVAAPKIIYGKNRDRTCRWPVIRKWPKCIAKRKAFENNNKSEIDFYRLLLLASTPPNLHQVQDLFFYRQPRRYFVSCVRSSNECAKHFFKKHKPSIIVDDLIIQTFGPYK